MSWGVSPWVYPVWDSLGFLDMGNCFLPHFREVIYYYLLKYFLMPFLFVFFFGTPMTWMLGHLTLSQRSLRLSSFNYFFFFPLWSIYFHHSIFHLTYPIFCLSYSTVASLQSALDLIYCIIWMCSTGVAAVQCWSSSCMALEQLWGDTPHLRTEKPQEDGKKDEIAFRIKLHSQQRRSEGSNKPCAHQDPEPPQTLGQNCVWVSPMEVQVNRGLPQGQGLWVQQTCVWHKPSWRRSPLTTP